MKAVGIIAEYNPFHYGHLRHLNEAKRVTNRGFAIVVMSGNHVQRGEPAITDKWRRARTALENGADVVIELPSYYSVAASDYFARGAVKLLNACGIVDCICFGSECGEIEPLKRAAEILLNEPLIFKNIIKQNLSAGMSFAKARGAALSAEFSARGLSEPAGLFSSPNNNLAIEYLKTLSFIKSSILPFTITRVKNKNIASASEIRSMLINGEICEARKFFPGEISSFNSLNGYSNYFKTFLYKARGFFKINLLGEFESCLSTPDMNEALLVRFLRETSRHETISKILSAVKTKSYTYTRLQRTVIHIILGITAGDMRALEEQGGPPYLRVLGFRKQGEPLIREMAANAALPLVIDAASARKRLPPFALRVFEREARDELSVPVIKI